MIRRTEKITKEKTLELVNIRRPHVDTEVKKFKNNIYAVCEYNKTNGILEGRVFVVENNMLRDILYFKNGQLHGDCRYYYSDGTRKLFKTFKDGKAEGNSQCFNRNGKRVKTDVYENGVLVRSYKASSQKNYFSLKTLKEKEVA